MLATRKQQFVAIVLFGVLVVVGGFVHLGKTSAVFFAFAYTILIPVLFEGVRRITPSR